MSEQPRVKIVCPECGGPLPLEAAHVAVRCARCSHVSAPVPAARASSAVEAPCPRCRTPLFRVEAYGVPIQGCGVCGGLFLDNEGSTRITRAKDSAIAALAERVRSRAIAPSTDTRPKDLPCPACSAPMRRVSKGFLEIDFCAAHGTWFDGGEVSRLMDAYAPRPNPVDVETASRAAAEARMAAFRDSQNNTIEPEDLAAAAGAGGVSRAVLGVLGALVGVADR